MKVWHLGRIPWRNIREIDANGDEYYRCPHLYCAFINDALPYEEFVAAELGADYDWPLDPDKKQADIIAGSNAFAAGGGRRQHKPRSRRAGRKAVDRR